MNTADIFDGLLANLKVDNSATIAARRDEITKALNKDFRGLEGSTGNKLMVGSYGRFTAIRGVSDLDLLYILPSLLWDSYKSASGPRTALGRVRDAIKARYPQTSVKVDRLVVVVQFQNFMFEVQPVFDQKDGSFKYPDTKSESWKTTKPRQEIKEISDHNAITKGNLRNLCRMARAWKNQSGSVMGGLLIDTLAYNFLQKTTDYDNATTAKYDAMARDFFQFLSEEDDHDYYAAVGSGQQVKVKKRFQGKAKSAYQLCVEAIAAEGKAKANKKWKEVFGQSVPAAEVEKEAASALSFRNTEEFIENGYPVDVHYDVSIDCNVTQKGFRTYRLRDMLTKRFPLLPQKSLDFTITRCTVPEPYTVKWKVLNRGDEAERRDAIRGEIESSNRTGHGRIEHTTFRGEHYVECYVIKDGVVVARDRIDVPIVQRQTD